MKDEEGKIGFRSLTLNFVRGCPFNVGLRSKIQSSKYKVQSP